MKVSLLHVLPWQLSSLLKQRAQPDRAGVLVSFKGELQKNLTFLHAYRSADWKYVCLYVVFCLLRGREGNYWHSYFVFNGLITAGRQFQLEKPCRIIIPLGPCEVEIYLQDSLRRSSHTPSSVSPSLTFILCCGDSPHIEQTKAHA